QTMLAQPGESLLPAVLGHVVAIDEVYARIGMAVEDLTDATCVGECRVLRQRLVDLRIGKIGVGDDAVRKAAAPRCVGDALQPAGLLDGKVVGAFRLEVD